MSHTSQVTVGSWIGYMYEIYDVDTNVEKLVRYHAKIQKIHKQTDKSVKVTLNFKDENEKSEIRTLYEIDYHDTNIQKIKSKLWILLDSEPDTSTEDFGINEEFQKKPQKDKLKRSSYANQLRQFDERLIHLENENETLHKKIKMLEDYVQSFSTTEGLPRLSGIITSEDMMLFNKLNAQEKGKYLGENAWYGISLNGTKMCASYKILDSVYRCQSKSFDSELLKYKSSTATFLSWQWYNDDEFIKMDAQDSRLISALKDRAVCRECAAGVFGADHRGVISMHNVGERTKVCAVCKVKTVNTQTKSVSNGLLVCTDCSSIPNAPSCRERILKNLIRPVEWRFAAMKPNTRLNENLGGKIADFVFTSVYRQADGVRGHLHIIIERDQDQHVGYNQEDERKKASIHVAQKLKGEETAKVLMIRYCPVGTYKDENGNIVDPDMTEAERVIVIRNWVIWYITTGNRINLKRLLVLYLWYDLNRKECYFASNHKGFGMAYMAPMGIRSKHEFSCEPSELAKYEKNDDRFAKCNKFVNVSHVFEFEYNTQDRLPRSVVDRM